MDMKDIAQLRKQLRRLEDEACSLAVFAASAKEIDAYDRLAMELHDVDTALFNAVFIKNNSKISKLINALQGTAAEANQVREQIGDLAAAFKKARKAVKDANNFAGKAKTALDDVENMLTQLQQDALLS